MNTTWLPNNISLICSEQQAPLTSCSSAGYMYLALVTRLFGGVNYSINYPNQNPYSNHPFLIPSPSTIFNSDSIEQNNNSYSSENKKSWKTRQTKEYDFIIIGGGSAGCVIANRLSEIKNWKVCFSSLDPWSCENAIIDVVHKAMQYLIPFVDDVPDCDHAEDRKHLAYLIWASRSHKAPDVLLLEAGPEEPDVTMVPSLAPVMRGSTIDWGYRTQPEPMTCRSIRGQTCPWLRGKSMGGSSAINYIVYMRGNKLDYDHWADLGNNGWSYSELLPYFKKSENNRAIENYDAYYHGVGGPITVERFSYLDSNTVMLFEAFKEAGLPEIDLTGENNIGTNIGLSTSRDGQRMSINVAYIKPIRDIRPNIDIIVNAFATKLIIDPKTKTAQGVTYVKNDVTYNVFAKKEVIVSSGSLNSPKLLMLSGIGPKDHLENLHIPVMADLAVGKNLQDHVTTEALLIALSNKTSTLVNNQVILEDLQNYYEQKQKKSGPLSTTGPVNGIGFMKTKYASVNAPDIQLHSNGKNLEEFLSDPQIYLETDLYPLAYYNSLSAKPILLTPKSRGTILLNKTDPIYGQPLIYPGFFTVKEDIDTLVEGFRYLVSLENTEAFKKSGAHYIKVPIKHCEHHIWGSYDYFACILMEYTSTIFHPVGTCKMGPAWDKEAVVDRRLRVYGVKRLRVIDASIMPYTVRGNTNIPTVTIAERACDMIKEDYFIRIKRHH